ncbi:MAG: hypothetical protein LBH29_02120 [Elusimicrobiota bacterium]|nr:hypothetical protein [Elusimicrobiota bacterium]
MTHEVWAFLNELMTIAGRKATAPLVKDESIVAVCAVKEKRRKQKWEKTLERVSLRRKPQSLFVIRCSPLSADFLKPQTGLRLPPQ